MEDLEKKFSLLQEEVDLALKYSAKNRLRRLLDRLEDLLKESLEIKKTFLIAAFYFLPDEIINSIREVEYAIGKN